MAPLLACGKTPGYPQSITLVLALGLEPYCTGEGDIALELVFSSTWTSSPIVVSKFGTAINPYLLVLFRIDVLLAHKHTQHDKWSPLGSGLLSIAYQLAIHQQSLLVLTYLAIQPY